MDLEVAYFQTKPYAMEHIIDVPQLIFFNSDCWTPILGAGPISVNFRAGFWRTTQFTNGFMVPSGYLTQRRKITIFNK